MTKTKLFVPLFVILVMGMATSAFAQLNCAVASGTISRATITGHAEPVGDISFTCAAGSTATGQATVTVSYPVTITNTTTYPAAAPIRITDNTGSFGVAGQVPTVVAVSNTTGQVVINLPPQGAAGVGPNAFTLRGVLVSLVGATAGTSLTANISVSPPLTPGANVLINSGDNTPTVITSIMSGINTTSAPPALAGLGALYLGNGTAITAARAGFAITTTENYIDMFKSAFNMTSNAATNSVQLQYTFSGMAPGSTIGPCVPTINTAGVTLSTTPAAGTTAAASAAGTATMTVNFTGVGAADSPNQTAIETVTLTCAGWNIGASTVNPYTTPITAVVTLAPTGAALGAGNAPFVTLASGGAIPRYASTPISIGTVVSFTPATTTMLFPFALGNGDANPPSGVFDTGIVVANTTGDPASFTNPATDQAGTITFTGFPSDGSATWTMTTASIPAGGSYIANLSDIMKAATPPKTGNFSGYIFAVANFTNGHGAGFVYGGSASNNRITTTIPALVIVSPAVQSRNGSPAGFPPVEYTTH